MFLPCGVLLKVVDHTDVTRIKVEGEVGLKGTSAEGC
jgi:hypothetical protein